MYGNYRQVSGQIGSVVFKRWSTSKSHLPDFSFFFDVLFHHLADFVYSLTSSLCAKVKSSHYVAVFIKPSIIWDFSPPKTLPCFQKAHVQIFLFFFKPPFSLSTFITACWSSKTMCLLKTFYSQLLPLYHNRGEKSLNPEGFFSFLKNLCKDIFKGCFHLMALYSTCHSRNHLTRLLYSFQAELPQ